MKNHNKKYNLNEGRVIGNNIINYGGFPKSIKEENVPTPNNLQPVTPNTSSPPLPPGNPVRDVELPTMTPTYPEQVKWWEAWQRANPSPIQGPNETWEAFRIRWQAYLDLWEAYQQWRLEYNRWQREQMYPG
jgi:hypothetical protein